MLNYFIQPQLLQFALVTAGLFLLDFAVVNLHRHFTPEQAYLELLPKLVKAA